MNFELSCGAEKANPQDRAKKPERFGKGKQKTSGSLDFPPEFDENVVTF